MNTYQSCGGSYPPVQLRHVHAAKHGKKHSCISLNVQRILPHPSNYETERLKLIHDANKTDPMLKILINLALAKESMAYDSVTDLYPINDWTPYIGYMAAQ
jgi:hypothetical protein